MFGNLEMDMIALESAINVFEMENGFNESFFESMSQVEPSYGAATESAYESDADDLFAGLFSDVTYTPATEGVGGKIASGITNIINAIKNFFVKLGSNLRNLGKKSKETADKAKNAELTPAEQNIYDQARDLRAAVKRGIGILNNNLKINASALNEICKKIGDGVDKAKHNVNNFKDTSIAVSNKKKREMEEGNRTALTNIGKSVVNQFEGKDDSEKADMAEIQIQEGEGYLKKVQAAESDMREVVKIIGDKYTALVKRINSLKTKAEGGNKSGNTLIDDIDNTSKDSQKSKEERAAEFRAVHAAKLSGDGTGTTAHTATVAGIKKILIKGYYIEDGDVVKEAVDAINAAAATCAVQEDNCKKIVEKAKDVSEANRYTRIAYSGCKLYKECAAVFARLSKSASAFADGKIFTSSADLKDDVFTDHDKFVQRGKNDDYEK